MEFNYEMYADTYLVFVLPMPTPRFTFRQRPAKDNALRAEITG
jgi:hypothetical protein